MESAPQSLALRSLSRNSPQTRLILFSDSGLADSERRRVSRINVALVLQDEAKGIKGGTSREYEGRERQGRGEQRRDLDEERN